MNERQNYADDFDITVKPPFKSKGKFRLLWVRSRLIMKEPIRLIWQCEECEDVVISYSHLRHDMNYCECGKSAVDLEEHYQRGMGKVKEISRKKNVDGKWINVC